MLIFIFHRLHGVAADRYKYFTENKLITELVIIPDYKLS